jgi:hypothetical protein
MCNNAASGEIVQHRARSHNVSAPVHPINIARTLHGWTVHQFLPLDGRYVACCRVAEHGLAPVRTKSKRARALPQSSAELPNGTSITLAFQDARILVAMFVVKDGTGASNR